MVSAVHINPISFMHTSFLTSFLVFYAFDFCLLCPCVLMNTMDKQLMNTARSRYWCSVCHFLNDSPVWCPVVRSRNKLLGLKATLQIVTISIPCSSSAPSFLAIEVSSPIFRPWRSGRTCLAVLCLHSSEPSRCLLQNHEYYNYCYLPLLLLLINNNRIFPTAL